MEPSVNVDFADLPEPQRERWTAALGATHLGRAADDALRDLAALGGEPGSVADLCARELARREALSA